MLLLKTEQSALDRISFLFLSHLMVSGGVPDTTTLKWTFDPGKTSIDSGFSRMHGGSVGEQNLLFLVQKFLHFQ